MSTKRPILHVLMRHGLFFSGNRRHGAWWIKQRKARTFRLTRARDRMLADGLCEHYGGKLYPL